MLQMTVMISHKKQESHRPKSKCWLTKLYPRPCGQYLLAILDYVVLLTLLNAVSIFILVHNFIAAKIVSECDVGLWLVEIVGV